MNACHDTDHSCKSCGHTGMELSCVHLVPIFNHLHSSQMDEIMAVARSRTYKKGELIYRAGETSSKLYIVSRGRMKIYRLSESGKEQVIRFLHPGDFTGEYALFNESIHESYAEAMEETSVCTIERADLQQLLLKFPTIALKLLQEFSVRLESLERQKTLVGTETVETRLALFLLDCMEEENNDTFHLPMSKKDLASFLGTTPETISRKLRELEEAGMIEQLTHKRIRIVDKDRIQFV